MSFEFDNSYVVEHGDPDDAKYPFYFAQDLRQFFPKTDGRGKYGNNTIGDILVKRGVIPFGKVVTIDTEYSCTYVYFKTEAAAKKFIKKLNEQPEVKNYEPPKPTHIVMKAKDWDRLNTKLKKMLTTEQLAKLTASEIMIEPVFNHSDGGYN